MFGFDASSFAIAGFVAAASPLVIHLFNRRRFKVVEWAAMDFLRKAIERNRKVLHLRDWLLLALRMAAVMALGLALARPWMTGASGWLSGLVLLAAFAAVGFVAYAVIERNAGRRVLTGVASLLCLFGALGLFWQSGGLEAANGTALSSLDPVHAILLVDNSRSMGAGVLSGTRLDAAKKSAHDFVSSLPPGSRVTVLPLAGMAEPLATDPYRTLDDARQAIDRIPVVDTAGSPRIAAELASEACGTAGDLPAKRVVIFSDLQSALWNDGALKERLSALPDLQIVPCGTADAGNVHVSSLIVEDGLVSVETPARVIARLEAGADQPTTTVYARLLADGAEVASQVIPMSAGQQYEAEFFWNYDGQVDPERPQWVELTVEISSEVPEADLLLPDNQRTILAPVLTAVPIVFVDQFGDQADVARGQIGETMALQHLLAPRSTSEFAPRPLYQIIRKRIDELDEQVLAQARCVVIAGVDRPGAATRLLKEYVQQGGPLVICAGGAFDPRGWMEDAWLDGDGILPAPLETEFVGVTPEEAPGRLEPFSISSDTLNSELFVVDGEDPEAMKSLFESLLFFKAVRVDVRQETTDQTLLATQQRLARDVGLLAGASAGSERAATVPPAASWWSWRSPLTPRRQELQKLREVFGAESPEASSPRSATWEGDRTAAMEQLQTISRRETPLVLARYSKENLPFLVERKLGDGRIIFCSSGITSDWNLMRLSPAMFIYHRLLTQLAGESLPQRNFETGSRIQWVAPTTSEQLVLKRPEGTFSTAAVEALGSEVYGFVIRRPVHAGVYELSSESAGTPMVADSTAEGDVVAPQAKNVAYSVAVGAPAIESKLEIMPPGELNQLVASETVRVLEVGTAPSVAGSRSRGTGLWQIAIGLMLLCLLVEMLVASRWTPRGGKEARP